jgi:hypothetical protein
MANKETLYSQETIIQGMLGRYLKVRNAGFKDIKGPHLDENELTAFTEGNLSEREASPIVSHLVDCSFCRNVTVELVRLDLAFADDTGTVPITSAAEPASISEVLSGLFSKIFGTSDGAVFAHQEDEEEKSDEDEEKK